LSEAFRLEENTKTGGLELKALKKL
jgi:hypothetical protein